MTQLTQRYGEALALAHKLHAGQNRKDGFVPYITHPLAVSALVLEHGGDEDEAIAGLLHDTVEDCGGKPVLDQIRARFGERVANIVNGCTDTYEKPKPEWRPRKEAFIERLKKADRSVLHVAACDKLHNARCLIEDYRALGELFWKRAWRGYEDSLWYYRSVSQAINFRMAGPVSWELDRAVGDLEQLVEGVRQFRLDLSVTGHAHDMTDRDPPVAVEYLFLLLAQIQGNAGYVADHLEEGELPDFVRQAVMAWSSDMESNVYDVRNEVHVLIDKLNVYPDRPARDPDAANKDPRVTAGLITEWLQDARDRTCALVNKTRDQGLVGSLVMECATNILHAVIEVNRTLSPLFPESPTEEVS